VRDSVDRNRCVGELLRLRFFMLAHQPLEAKRGGSGKLFGLALPLRLTSDGAFASIRGLGMRLLGFVPAAL
jgi:hypothetical protein